MLALVTRRSPPETPSAPATPARAALVKHQQDIAAQLAHLHDLGAVVRDAAIAAARLAQAQRTLDDIAEAERHRIEEWTRTPRGPLPAPLDRADALAELAAATQQNDIAGRRSTATESARRRAEEQLHALNRALPPLPDACVVETAAALVTRLRQLRLEAAAHVGTLNGLRDTLLSANRHAAASALDKIADADAMQVNETEALIMLANQQAARTLRQRLSDDASATVEPDCNIQLPRQARSAPGGHAVLRVASAMRQT